MNLKKVVEDEVSMTRGLLQNKPVELKLTIADGLPLLIADPVRVRQVLLNLLSNAAKFTKQGHIWVTVWQEQNSVFVSVKDTGIGIAQEDLSLVFEDYQQVSTKQHSCSLSDAGTWERG